MLWGVVLRRLLLDYGMILEWMESGLACFFVKGGLDVRTLYWIILQDEVQPLFFNNTAILLFISLLCFLFIILNLLMILLRYLIGVDIGPSNILEQPRIALFIAIQVLIKLAVRSSVVTSVAILCLHLH